MTVLVAACILAFIFAFSLFSARSRRAAAHPAFGLLFELVGLASTFLPAAFSSNILRFLGGIFCIMCFLSMHIRICRHIWPTHGKSPDNGSSGVFSILDFRNCTFYRETLETIFYHSLSFVEQSDGGTSLRQLGVSAAHCLCALFVGDGCVLVLFELMPRLGAEPEQHVYLTSLLVGMWLYCGLELAYVGHGLLLWASGSRLNKYFRHRTPILSVTLSEFWGVRWNPVIMKLLQNSFYVPLRRWLPPGLCAAATFTGSAWLHAFPQYLHSFSAADATRVALFFCVHGALVILERGAISTLTCPGNAYVSSRVLYAHRRQSLCCDDYRLDFVLYCLFCVFMSWRVSTLNGDTALSHADSDAYAVLTFASLCLSAVVKHRTTSDTTLVRTAVVTIGWIWTIGWVLLTLPLLTIPALKVLRSSYSQSFFTGPLLQGLIRFGEDE